MFHDLRPALLLAACSPLFCTVSCSVHPDEYDTPPPYQGVPTEGSFDAAGNPVYDSQAAYGDGASQEPGGIDPGLPADPGDVSVPDVPSAPSAPPVTQPAPSATVHTVVRGDTLSGISTRYGVSMAAIREANQMTSDVVVLGKKLVIPAR